MGLKMKIRFTDVLQCGTLRNTYASGKLNGYQVDVRMGYYRGHYLSTIDHLSIMTDGKREDESDISFCLNGKEFGPAELKHLVSEFWPVLEPATIKVRRPGGLAPGEHIIELTLILRSPYMPQPGSDKPHSYVPIDSSECKTMTLAEGGV